MPIATTDQYAVMLDAAASGHYAFAGVTVTSAETLNAALEGFAQAGTDGIVQVSTGSGQFLPGDAREMALGSRALAAFAQIVGERCRILIALHADHRPPGTLDGFLRPLLAEPLEGRRRGEQPLFHSQMFAGSALPLENNLTIASELLEQCAQADVGLEIECGVVGGEEDGMRAEGPRESLYTTTEELLRVAERLGTGERGRYLLAATFGNVHGVYAPGRVELRPRIVADGQQALSAAHPVCTFATCSTRLCIGRGDSRGDLLRVVKMDIDSDTQYAFTRSVAGHMVGNYDGVLEVAGGVGRKQGYDPRSWGREARVAMVDRVAAACGQLGSAGRGLAR